MKSIDTTDVQLPIKSSATEKIKAKLTRDDTTRYGVGGMYKGHHNSQPYGFQYICRGCYLLVEIEHKAMIGIETAEELQEQVLSMVTDYFNISRDDIQIHGTLMLDKLEIKRKKVIRVSRRKYIKVKHVGWMIKCRIQITKKLREEIQEYKMSNKKKIRVCLGSISKNVDLMEINRIEMKNDYKLKNADEPLVAQDIIRMATEKIGRLIKEEDKYKNRTNCQYKSRKNNSVAITIYFKEFERLEKSDVAGAEKYNEILRTEVKLKNKHLNNNRKRRNKTLKDYFRQDVAEEYFNEYVLPIFYTEPFYRLDVAQFKIYESELFRDFEKDRLYQFLVDINKFGISAVKEKYDSSTFKEYIRKIRSLGINPLCFSKVIDGKEITIKKMENFTLLKNGIDHDI